jgi:MscS family membrane protein
MLAFLNIFEDPALIHLLIGIGILVGSGIIGKLLKGFLHTSVFKFIVRTKTTLDDHIFEAVSKNVFALCLIGGAYFGIEEVRGAFDLQRHLEHRILDYLTIAVYVLLVFALARLVSQLIKATAEWYAEDISMARHKDISSTVPIASKIVNIIFLTIALLIVLDHVGVNVGSLLVSLGVGSLAIALAAQETISNLIAWFVIVMDQPVRIGDQVKLSTGEEGTIHQIGLRATRILNFDNNIVVVPNGELVKSRVINYGMPVTTTRVLVELAVAYGTDIDAARAIMIGIAAKNPNVLGEPAPQVYVMNFTDSGVLLRLTGRSSVPNKFDAETSIREEIYKKFRDNGISFAVPRRISRIIKDSNEPQTAK